MKNISAIFVAIQKINVLLNIIFDKIDRKMKKTILVIAIAAALSALVGACRVIDPCPAYSGETSVEQVDNLKL